jgi:hypothetical protein
VNKTPMMIGTPPGGITTTYVTVPFRLANPTSQALRAAAAQGGNDAELMLRAADEMERLLSALSWCSGSPSFAPEGEAHAGWQAVAGPLLRSVGVSKVDTPQPRATSPHSDYEIEARGPTHRVDLYVGLMIGGESAAVLDLDEVRGACRDWVRDHGIGMTFAPTTFIYPGDGPGPTEEPGVIIGMILNPRMRPLETADGLTLTGIRLAFRLLGVLKQERIYVVASDETLVVRRRRRDEGSS